jgi:hypothetical protein
VTPPAWLRAAVLAVYPPRVRERYGEEVADLLDHSPRPWHDLSDVAWNATWERVGSVREAPLRPYAVRMMALGLAPMVFMAALFMLSPVVFMGAGALGAVVGRGYIGWNSAGVDDDIFLVIAEALAVALVAVLAVRIAHRWTDALRIPALTVTVPTMMVLGSVAMIAPLVGLNAISNSQEGYPVDPAVRILPISAAAWWVLLTALAVGYGTLRRRGRTAAAWIVVVVATVAVPVLTGAIYSLMGPRSAFPGFADSMSLPPLATVSTLFTFLLLRIADRRPVSAETG